MAHKNVQFPSRPAAATRARRHPTRALGVPSERDLERAKEDALLQLRIGRTAHYYCVIIFAALFLDGFLVNYWKPAVITGGSASLNELFFLSFPLLGGVLLSAFGVSVKWRAYQLWPWEQHFSATLAALGLNLLLMYLYFARLVQYGPTAHWALLPWFFPLVLLAVGAPLVALAMTWPAWSRRKVGSIVAALAPIPFSALQYAPAAGTAPAASALALTFIASGGLYLLSGSLLHLISSGTEMHERELISSGQTQLFAIADETKKREEAVRFREATLVRREADVEAAEAELAQQRTATEQARGQLESFETELKSRADKVGQEEEAVALLSASVSGLQRNVQDREGSLQLKEEQFQNQASTLAEREKAAVDLEGDVSRQRVQVETRERELAARDQSIVPRETRLEARQQEIDKRMNELLRLEAEAKVRGSGPSVPGAAALTERETRLTRLEAVLAEQNEILGRKAKQNEQTLAEVRQRLEEQVRREQQLASREAVVTQKEAEAGRRMESASQRQKRYEEAVRNYEEKLQETERKEVEIRTRLEEANRASSGMTQRERTNREMEAALIAQRQAIEKSQRETLERQRSLEALESELSLRMQTFTERASRPSQPSSLEADERVRSLEARERALRDREAQVARREYQDQHAPAGTEGPLQAPPVQRKAERLPTGIARLDDLLLGGIPPRGHVAVVGPPFIGKELAIYAFLAEGLKMGESVVILTTSKAPTELAQELGLVTPQLREYEQMGRVLWIDASNPNASTGKKGADANQVVVQGPGDHAGILTALVQGAQNAEKVGSGALRVGFLSLSACMSQGDDRSGFAFLQNLVGILKQRAAIALYAIDRGTVTDAQVETIQTRMDGALLFKQDHGKTVLSVQGVGEVATREWIEYRATNRALLIGSFALERIR